MNKISKILIPFNFSKNARNALDFAVDFSKKASETKITLLFIATEENGANLAEIEAQLLELINSYNAKYSTIELSYIVTTGALVGEILKKNQEIQSDLIIMGTKGSLGNEELNSTNSSKLIHEAECPVIVVPEGYEHYRFDTITLALDKSDIENPDLLKILLIIARRYNAKIHVLTVYDENDEDFLKDRKNENVLEYYFERYYATSSAKKSSKIADTIMGYNTKNSIDMLAIIPRNHSKLQNQSEGRLAQYLTLNSNIPILIID